MENMVYNWDMDTPLIVMAMVMHPTILIFKESGLNGRLLALEAS